MSGTLDELYRQSDDAAEAKFGVRPNGTKRTENTDGVLVPRTLIEALDRGDPGAVDAISDLLNPPEPTERLRVVNLDVPDSLDIGEMQRFVGRHEQANEPGASQVGALLSRISQALDAVSVIDDAIDDWWTTSPEPESAELKARIRAAFGVS